jgi:phenylacetate-CoA ligase
LLKSQWWSSSDLKLFQDEKLRGLVIHAYNNVPYYNELFKENKLHPKDIHSIEDLPKLPILTKEIIKKNFPHKISARNIKKNKQMLLCSSGSTGEPLMYSSTRGAYSFKMATNLRGLYWHGFRLGDRHCKFSTNPRQGITKRLQDIITRCKYISSQGVTQEDIVKNVQELIEYKPKMIYGYPSTLSILAEYIGKNNIKELNPLFINTHGEILFPYMREMIEQNFYCPVYDAYSGEGGAVSFQCDSSEAYHIADEYAITEIVNDGETIIDKGRGEIISTDLWNYATPMIRYNIKDIGIIKKETCNCKKGLSTMHKIEGRDSDMLITPSGKYLIVHFFTGYFEWIHQVDQFQVIQNKTDEIELYIKANNKYSKSIQEKIIKDVQEYIGEDIQLQLKIVDNIPLTKSGKRRFMIRNIFI